MTREPYFSNRVTWIVYDWIMSGSGAIQSEYKDLLAEAKRAKQHSAQFAETIEARFKEAMSDNLATIEQRLLLWAVDQTKWTELAEAMYAKLWQADSEPGNN